MRPWIAASLLCLCPTVVSAETIARQAYTVTIPRRLQITAPPVSPRVEMAQDATQAALPMQAWTVSSNSPDGAIVQFSTQQSFHNLDDDTIRRDVRLDVSVPSQIHAANWTVTKSSAVTDHRTGQEQASVEIRSSRPGTAQIELQVTLLAAEANTPTGDYVTTVVGTITAP